MCQPPLGASLRKGWFRMIGTPVGAVAIVVLTACFFAGPLPIFYWSGAVGGGLGVRLDDIAELRCLCGALAGYTGVIIASGQLGLAFQT